MKDYIKIINALPVFLIEYFQWTSYQRIFEQMIVKPDLNLYSVNEIRFELFCEKCC